MKPLSQHTIRRFLRTAAVALALGADAVAAVEQAGFQTESIAATREGLAQEDQSERQSTVSRGLGDASGERRVTRTQSP